MARAGRQDARCTSLGSLAYMEGPGRRAARPLLQSIRKLLRVLIQALLTFLHPLLKSFLTLFLQLLEFGSLFFSQDRGHFGPYALHCRSHFLAQNFRSGFVISSEGPGNPFLAQLE